MAVIMAMPGVTARRVDEIDAPKIFFLVAALTCREVDHSQAIPAELIVLGVSTRSGRNVARKSFIDGIASVTHGSGLASFTQNDITGIPK
jgi:hypothetical protein